jgi:acetyltransferase-like isoleucine patch superfamily enzyme
MLNNRTAIVSPNSRLGKNVTIGDFTIVYDNVVLGDDVRVESHCILGYPTPLASGKPLVIGNAAHIRSHSIFYEGSKFGNGLRTGHHVTVRENVDAGTGLQLGTLTDLQGDTKLGDYVRTHSNVHLGKRTNIGNFVWLFPYTVLTNDPHPPSNLLIGVTVEDYAVIATMSCVLPGVRIGARSLVGAHSLVTKDVEPDTVVVGVPAKRLCTTSEIKMKDGTGEPAYPWMRHFQGVYPENVLQEWRAKFGRR